MGHKTVKCLVMGHVRSKRDIALARLIRAGDKRAVLSYIEDNYNDEDFKVPNLNRKIVACIERHPEAFDMQNWHGERWPDGDVIPVGFAYASGQSATCGTVHCIAGWAVVLAKPVARAYEWALNCYHAVEDTAKRIYKASNEERPSFLPSHYGDDLNDDEVNRVALANLKELCGVQ